MQISVIKARLDKKQTDVIILPCFQNQETKGAVTLIDSALEGLLTRAMKEENFKAKLGRTFSFHTHEKLGAKRIIIVGLGKKEEVNTEHLRRASATALKCAKTANAKKIAVALPRQKNLTKIDSEESAYALASGALLANYRFLKYQKTKQKKAQKQAIETLEIIAESNKIIKQAEKGIIKAEQFIPGVFLTRNLVNEPALDVTPKRLVNEAEKIAKSNPNISLKVFGEEKLRKMGANALLAVSRGSDEPAFLIHLTYKPKTKAKKRIVLAGKGLTFDAGGLSIKPQEGMKSMKLDMAGAATVFGIFSILAETNTNHEIHGVIPASENLISGKAIKPGDVVTALNGKTIEIINTDAEGRLILADAFSYLGTLEGKWDALIDFATLTGACIIALGEQVAGMFGNNPKLKEKILKASKIEKEQIWEMPLVDDYKSLLKSQIADIANVSKSKTGGAITGGLFLQRFVPKNTPWVHLDIAGPAWEEKGEIPYIPKGGTGFGVRSIARFLEDLS